MGMMGIFGNKRNGKDVLTHYWIHKTHVLWNEHGRDVRLKTFTNYKCGLGSAPNSKEPYPENEVITVDRLLELEGLDHGCLGVSEAPTWGLDSRVSNSRSNRYVSYFAAQSGKRTVDIWYNAQLGNTVDLRWVDITEYQVVARKDKENSRFVYKYLVPDTAKLGTWVIPFSTASMWWNDYDTYEIFKAVGLKEMQAEIEKLTNNKRFNARVDELVSRLEGCADKLGWFRQGDIYEYTIEDWLLREDEPLMLSKAVVNRLKERFRVKAVLERGGFGE